MTPAPESPGQGKEGPGGAVRPSPHVISLPAHARLSGLCHRWPGSGAAAHTRAPRQEWAGSDERPLGLRERIMAQREVKQDLA